MNSLRLFDATRAIRHYRLLIVGYSRRHYKRPGGAAVNVSHGELQSISLHVNGTEQSLAIEPRVSLLDALRDHLFLPGTKKGCNQGACGACTVLVDGERINSCLALAMQCQDRQITTIEGLGAPGVLHPLQVAFVEHDGFQCGYCTPGQICSAVGMAEELKRGVPSAVTEDLAAYNIGFSDEEI